MQVFFDAWKLFATAALAVMSSWATKVPMPTFLPVFKYRVNERALLWALVPHFF